MCEFCPVVGCCNVCGYDPDADPQDDPKLEAARLGRLSGRCGGGPQDNPYPPGSVLYGWFGGGQLTARLEAQTA